MGRLDNRKINCLANFHPFYRNLEKDIIIEYLTSLQQADYNKILKYQHAFGMINAAHLHHLNTSNESFTNLIEKINAVEVREFESLLPKIDENSLKKTIAAEFNYQKRK